MEKNFAIYKEMRAAAERIFNEGISAPAAPADSIQAVDTADTLHVAPVAHAKNPYIIGPAKN